VPTDRELVARVLVDDDRHAFGTLVREHQAATRAFLRRLTSGDAALADDLAQETFLRAYRSLASYRGEARLSSWLFAIAWRVFLSDARRRRDVLLGDGASDALAAEAAPAPPLDGATERHDLERAMRALRADERAALALCFASDLSHEEAASVLGCPVGTLKTHVQRGKEKLRKRLAPWREEVAP
jgi:RNA polymerase sigma-70 factor (ECF subfamily)